MKCNICNYERQNHVAIQNHECPNCLRTENAVLERHIRTLRTAIMTALDSDTVLLEAPHVCRKLEAALSETAPQPASA